MIYSRPSEFRLEGRLYLKTVPATLKFWGLSMAELPLKKKCPYSSASASKGKKETNVMLCAELRLCWHRGKQTLCYPGGGKLRCPPTPRQLSWDLHTPPDPLLTQDVFCLPAFHDEDVHGTGRDAGDEHVT